MSDVEKQIDQWRAGLAGSETFDNADIRELESHLREEIEHLKSVSLSDEEAFLVARHRLGDTAALEGEFQKINGCGRLLRRFCWGIMAVLLYFTAATFASAASYLSLRLGYMAGLQQLHLAILAGAMEIAVFAGTILLALWLYARHLYHRTNRLSRDSKAMPVLAATLAIGTLAFLGIRILLTQMIWRLMDIKGFSKISYAGAWGDFAFRIAAPVLLAALFVVLYRKSRSTTPAQG